MSRIDMLEITSHQHNNFLEMTIFSSQIRFDISKIVNTWKHFFCHRSHGIKSIYWRSKRVLDLRHLVSHSPFCRSVRSGTTSGPWRPHDNPTLPDRASRSLPAVSPASFSVMDRCVRPFPMYAALVIATIRSNSAHGPRNLEGTDVSRCS